MHFLIFWGFVVLLIGTTLLSIHEHIVKFLMGNTYIVFSVIMEIAGLFLISGTVIAIFRRYILKVKRLQSYTEDLLILLFLILIVSSGFLLEALRLAQNPQTWEKWSFVGWYLKELFGPEVSKGAYPYIWWFHAILSLSFLLLIPLTKLAHTILAPTSIYLQNLTKEDGDKAQMEEEDSVSEGSDKEAQVPQRPFLTLSHLIFLDACMRCGRCVEVCPSTLAGEDYAPRDFVQGLRAWVWQSFSPHGDPKLFMERSPDRIQRIWNCTTCRACLEVCPVYGPTFELVMGERALAIEEGTSVPDLLNQTLERLYKYENPWMSSKKEKLGWIEEGSSVGFITKSSKPEFCYFVGCTTSVDPRARGIAKAFSSILQSSGLEFGIFGEKEPCCGDMAKRVGELGLFEEKKMTCSDLFETYGVKNVVTSSPHCYFNFKNDYPQGMFNVFHYTQLLHKLIKEGNLTIKKRLNFTVTYHDPCYLGRHSRIFDEPREIIKAIPGLKLIEMTHNRENSLCCGGGGGRMWQGNELNGTERMSERRAKEAKETGADVVLTACPLCLIMMEDAVKTLGYEKNLKVMDINELLKMAIDEKQG
ncbi:MAG: (Fe-S)-binding protein [Desulfatiglandales bacterium]